MIGTSIHHQVIPVYISMDKLVEQGKKPSEITDQELKSITFQVIP